MTYKNHMDNTPRIYGANNIKRALQRQKRDYTKDAHTSIADKPHSNSKEIERRLKQAERKAAKDAAK